MSLGLVTRASCGRRGVIGIGEQGVVWVAPCLGDRLGGAVSLGLVTRASSGWRRVIGIADQGVVWVAPCPKRFILKGPPCIESSFLRFGTGPGSGGSKRHIFKCRACTESSLLISFSRKHGEGSSAKTLALLHKLDT